uniref:hypothetical protein n=1 Tax=Archangium gephyra TaxID=48 RepID=UPI0035D47452
MDKMLVVFGLVALVAGGCVPEEDLGGETAGEADGTLITETLVTVDAEGREVVRTRTMTQAESDRVLAAREALANGSAMTGQLGAGGEHLGQVEQAISADSECAGASLWLHDGAAQTGNRICFARTLASNDATSLGSYCRLWQTVIIGGRPIPMCTSTWSGAVRSYWAGADNGTFTSSPTTQPAYFNAWERNDYPNASVTGATAVELASTCRRRLCPQSACSAGEWCNNGVCTINPLNSWCVNGISYNSGGDSVACNYYACGSDGHCKRSCTTSMDCANGAACDVTTGLCSMVFGGTIYWMSGETHHASVTPSQPASSVGSCSYPSCTSDANCTGGDMCHNGKCVPFTQHCTEDLNGMVWWDRATYDCGEYRCNPNRGYCPSECRTSLDCRAGYACDGQRCI